MIDEIARMELFSKAFREAVLEALDSASPTLASLQQRRDPFLDGIRKRQDVALHVMTLENRDGLAKEVLHSLHA